MARKKPEKTRRIKPIERRLIDRQESLFEKLQALAREVERLAKRNPTGAVPEAIRVKAEALLFDSLGFRPGRRGELPVAAPHLGGLATQLADALAALVAYEQRHTFWDHARNLPRWQATRGVIFIKRMSPRPGTRTRILADHRALEDERRRAAEMLEIRAKLAKLLAAQRLAALNS